jgi:catecholate siderophore receptor
VASEKKKILSTATALIAVSMIGGTLARPVFAQSSAPVFQSPLPSPIIYLKGRVMDSIGLPLEGASVTVQPGPRGSSAPAVTALTNAAGEFTIALGPGTHTLILTAPGFADLSRRVDTGQIGAGRRDFTLQVAGVRESVSVTGAPGYGADTIRSATRTPTPLSDVPQSVTVVTRELIKDQLMVSMADVVKYVPGITAHQGENNRDDVVIRGNRSSADFFLNGVRDDVQYYRDLYNLDRVEALKGPNAMIFGRGGAGGVVNRVTKEAGLQKVREASLQAGAFDNRRLTGDLNQPLTSAVAFRVNGMFENSGSFRNGVDRERGAVNPTLTFASTDRTRITAGYEYLRDTRVADRGLTSFQGRPADVDDSTFYGNPRESHVRARVNLASALIEHRFGEAILRNRTMAGRYNRFYQNFVPGAVTADRAQVALTAYNNASDRTNVFNQTDLTVAATTGRVRHTILAGAEAGRQATGNFRQSGFFNNTAVSILVPFADPTITTPVTFRQSATDADNHVRATVAAAFAQDQVEVSRHLQLIGGIRFERFDLHYQNNRDGASLKRADSLVSPRAGIVFKPTAPLSLYGSYSVSYLPSSGDQFSSLTLITQQLKPEQFTNYELGLKWTVLRALSVTSAVYRLERTNTRSTDPNDPTRIVQMGSQRTNGFELGTNGQITRAWKVAGGYAYQNAFVTRATAAARVNAQVSQVPHHTFSLWNSYQFHRRLSAALGVVHRSDMFAAIDNTVTLPGYTEADVAAFFTMRKGLRLQANLENLFDLKYFVNADSNTNISPGSPRALRVALVVAF